MRRKIEQRMQLYAPSDNDLNQLAKQWLLVSETVNIHYGYRLDQSLVDLDYLQNLIDDQIYQPDQTYELQCLGVAFGRVVINNLDGLDWSIIDDEWGRDPTLRYLDTTITVNVLTMLSKRIEKGEKPSVKFFYEKIPDTIATSLRQGLK